MTKDRDAMERVRAVLIEDLKTMQPTALDDALVELGVDFQAVMAKVSPIRAKAEAEAKRAWMKGARAGAGWWVVTAPRVPAGWTREAADIVWEDWRRAVGGEEPDFIDILSDHVAEGRWPESGMDAAESLAGLGVLKWDRRNRPYFPHFASPEARLRAWAAVGAPVLAPAEDGKPSLAEWVAAAEGSALGRPSWSAWKAFFSRPHRHRIDCELLDDGSALVTDWGDHFSQWAAMPFSTPAELRACLDRLAGGVS